MASNIEIKARANDFSQQQQIARQLSGKKRPTLLEQEDTFFATPNGRLKLRLLGPKRAELIFYQRADQAGPRPSHYLIARTAEPQALKDVLSAALPVIGIVRKRRTLYRVGQTRIHLDEVEGLGQFIELEYVLQPGEEPLAGQQAVEDLMAKLDIRPDDLTPQAYLDLLTAPQPQTVEESRPAAGEPEKQRSRPEKDTLHDVYGGDAVETPGHREKPWVRYWGRHGERYDHHLRFAAGDEVLRQMRTVLQRDKSLGRVLELGCGTGFFTSILAENAEAVTATDLSGPLLSIARRRLRRFEHVSFRQVDCEQIGFPDASFDTVFMANLITIVDANKTLAECRRVLKPGGQLLIVNIVAQRMKWFDRVSLVGRTLFKFGIPPLGRKDYSPERLAALVSQKGFRVKQARLLGQQIKFVYLRAAK
ncbi:MAG: methyltransferase domain-containing protein [Chloroflexota bacterium]